MLRYFRDVPRPNKFARELPLPIDTKLIERHKKGVLRKWLDLVLPPHVVRSDEEHFERRFGLRYAEPHVCVRLLDPQLQHELGWPCCELSLPLHTLGQLPVSAVQVFIVENKINLLTFPPRDGAIALWGKGCAVTELRYIGWLAESPITYWGDMDVAGFQILSSLRAVFPTTRSFLMDKATLERFGRPDGDAPRSTPDVPLHLTETERAAFLRCRDENLHLEQEHIPQAEVVAALSFSEVHPSVRCSTQRNGAI